MAIAEEYLIGSHGPERLKMARDPISAATSGAGNTLVAAVAGAKIRVMAYDLVARGAVNAKFQSGGTTDLTGTYTFAAAGAGKVNPFNHMGWFETAAGEALTLSLSGATSVDGVLDYIVLA